MKLLRLYARVLGRLGPDRPLGVLHAAANVLLAIAAFAQPILFGRIVDALYMSGAPGSSGTPGGPSAVARLVATWAAFGLFTIGAGVVVALHADRLAHRRRLAVIADYFEHALRLPAGLHSETHSE